ncbi:MAG: putative monovalent cation/H+ antiporter subunit A, partial [bacterium]|nr:putative monovalent cation/H+ antiporter subunit A [bacterium]
RRLDDDPNAGGPLGHPVFPTARSRATPGCVPAVGRIVLIAVLIGFAGALAAPAVVRVAGARAGWWLASIPAGLTAYFLTFLPRLANGEIVEQRLAWVPQLGVEMSMRVDGLSLLFALMIAGIGTFIVIYGGGYLAGDRQLPRFYLLLLSFMAAMLGVVLTDDLVTLFVFWELTSLTSYFLVGYKHEYEDSRTSALQALLVTGTGGLAMLAGFLLLGGIGGTLRISELVANPAVLVASPWYAAALVLVAAGALTKSAQWPFHFWLPNAMAAPTPVSAYLHSATMVKAGVYLLARLSPGLGGTPLWFWLLTIAGAATILAASGLALVQRDTKRLLAYSTLIALGTLVMLIGVGTAEAIKAMVVFTVAHALYKAPLFMVAGSVDHEAGSRDVTRLSGLGRLMPITWVTALLAGISAAGWPPMLGFVGKELAYEGLFQAPWLLVALIAASAVMLVIVVLVAWRPFAGREARSPRTPHEAPLSMWLGPLLIAGLGVVLGFAPALLQDGLMRPAAAAVLGRPYAFDLYLWHGWTLALGLSILTVALGAALVWAWPRVHPILVARAAGATFGPAAGYFALLRGLVRVAALQTRWLQSDDLRHHLSIILAFTVGLTGIVALVRGAFAGITVAPFVEYLYEIVLLLVIVAAVISVVRAHSRVVAITSLGVVGFGIALVFVLFGAPDLAITQFLVETLVVIIVALVLVRMPSGALLQPGNGRVRALAGVIAGLGGVLVAGLLIAVTGHGFDPALTRFFEAESYPAANGRNIVNVILVDFRAIDTLGEIAVLAIAATGVYALMRRVLPKRGGGEKIDQAPATTPAPRSGGPR